MKPIILYIIFMNLFSYLAMWFDKNQSKKKGYRIPESRLLLFALLFGAVGIYLGMKAPIYHKSAKPKFKIAIPFLILLNVIFAYYLVNKGLA